MPMKNLEQVYTLYTQYQQLEGDAKTNLLNEIKESNPELYTQLVQIINSEEDASHFFENLERDVMSSLFHQQVYSPGTVIGAYQLDSQLGSGGMAYVFKAERVDGSFERQVAIKFIKRGIDTDEVIRRFQLERNVLAGLDHENIAQLYDGGITDDGLPYFVMEFIDGSDIHNYCDSNHLHLKARLRLFLQVCQAVDFAHKNLIVHRDIKPGNILVKNDGQVKLTDFGIAKMLDSDKQEELTHANQLVMTREYASPEQRTGKRINTASDIYQIGILLYELMTRQKAWSKEAARHQLTFKNKILPTELKSIIQTATMEEPDQRYNSIEALNTDVENYLQNKPVKARGKSNWYIFRKFMARNKVAVAASALILIVIGAGLTKYIMDINQARKVADYRTVQANSMANFYFSSFSRQYPTYADGDTLNAFELLKNIENYLGDIEQSEQEFDGISMVNSFRFHGMLGDIYMGWNNHGQALQQYLKAAEVLKNKPEFQVESIYNFDEVNIHSAIGMSYLWLGKTDSAIKYYNKAIRNPGNKNKVQEISGLAYAHVLLGKYQTADSIYQVLFDHLKHTQVPEEELVSNAVAIGRLCSFYTQYYFDEKKEVIDSLFQQSLAIFETKKIFSSEPSYKVFQVDNVKRKYTKKGDKYKVYHPESYAETLNYYGMYLYTDRQYDSALYYFEKAYEANLKYFGQNNLKSLDNLNNIAAIQRNTGNIKKSMENFYKCWQMSQANRFFPIARALNYYQNYAGSFFNLHQYRKCLSAMDTLLQMKKQYAPNDVYAINNAKITMADCYYELGDHKRAINIYNEVITDHQKAFGNKGNTDLQASVKKIKALAHLGKNEEVRSLYADNQLNINERLGESSSLNQLNHQALVSALIHLENFEEAEQMVTFQMQKELSQDLKYVYQALLASCYFKQGNNQQANELYQQLKKEPLENLKAKSALAKLEKTIGKS